MRCRVGVRVDLGAWLGEPEPGPVLLDDEFDKQHLYLYHDHDNDSA